jgi:beta-galactosidase
LKTAGEAKNITLVPDKTTIACSDVAHIEVSITDRTGTRCPNEEIQVDFSLSGDGEILGACSPDLTSGQSFTQPKAVTSGGKALVMIRAGASTGALELCAYNEKFEPTTLKFKVK